jgi:hypothetical protein
MARWNNTLTENCIEVMDTVIKNLESTTRSSLLESIVLANVENTKKEIEIFIRSALGITGRHAKRSRDYWKSRGWPANIAYAKSKEHKHKNTVSVYSREFWLNKVNPITNKHYTVEEADFERNSRRPIRKEYWMKKGYCETDATRFASNSKIANNKKGANASAKSEVRKVSSKRCPEFFIARGHTKEEATELVAKGQTHFSKEICIEKYGKEKGLEIWKNRQDRWQATLNAKPMVEKASINRLKLTKGITVSAAEREILNEIRKVNNSLPIIEQLTLSRNSKKQYVYDISVANKIIEYNGDFWHCNPKKYSPDYINPRTKLLASEKWKLDEDKIQFAESQGYDVLVIWESEFKQNKKEVFKKCLQFLKQ